MTGLDPKTSISEPSTRTQTGAIQAINLHKELFSLREYLKSRLQIVQTQNSIYHNCKHRSLQADEIGLTNPITKKENPKSSVPTMLQRIQSLRKFIVYNKYIYAGGAANNSKETMERTSCSCSVSSLPTANVALCVLITVPLAIVK